MTSQLVGFGSRQAGLNPAMLLVGCVTLGSLFNNAFIQFLHLYHGDKKNPPPTLYVGVREACT